ncbi:long-chain fatty acid--CoA ligase [Glycomyces sp. NPDC048151]|uniref:long-chain-fatty-acid--CoA ligase n=1 Tax=Glycomyces sp. NPDC048151 TaxID=3364002 RepID=UPI003724187D
MTHQPGSARTGQAANGPGPTREPDPALDGPGQGTLSIAAILAETARRRPEAPALHFMDQTIAYGDLWNQTRAYAGALAARGIGPGSRVAMIIPNVPDFPRVYYAALALGAVVIPIHLLFKSEEIRFVLEDAEADLVVAAAPMLAEAAPAAALAGIPLVTVLAPEGLELDGRPVDRLEAEAATAAPIDRYASVHPLAAATILYTSGTTGTPKGAVGSHLAVIEQVHTGLLDTFEYRPDDVLYGGLPFFHTFGQTVVLNAGFRRGAAIILLPKFDPDEALALLVRHKATVFAGVPTNYAAMVAAATRSPDRPPLRIAISGGAALPTALLEAFEVAYGAQVHEGYGLTETSPVASFNLISEPIRPGTVGKSIWGVDVAVADPEAEDRIDLLPPDTLGEIVVRGHNLMKGYLGRPDATATAVVDGWFRTGDLGTVDGDGVIRIVDRKKDMIIRNGYNVYPTEVEAVLSRHPAVALAAVFGVPHEEHGQEVHAAIVPAEGAEPDPAELVAYVKAKIAAYKYPRVVHVVEALPLGPSGKILKRELQRLYGDAPAA